MLMQNCFCFKARCECSKSFYRRFYERTINSYHAHPMIPITFILIKEIKKNWLFHIYMAASLAYSDSCYFNWLVDSSVNFTFWVISLAVLEWRMVHHMTKQYLTNNQNQWQYRLHCLSIWYALDRSMNVSIQCIKLPLSNLHVTITISNKKS